MYFLVHTLLSESIEKIITINICILTVTNPLHLFIRAHLQFIFTF